MSENIIIDLKLIRDESLFKNITEQKDAFVKMFSELGNLFPKEKLVKVHSKANGVKVTKGNNLQNCPYQVLDLIQDFDLETGMNIRILNWWGHGMMILILYGNQTALKYETSLSFNKDFFLSKADSPWDYKSIMESFTNLENLNLKEHLSHCGHLQIFKFIEIEGSFYNMYLKLKLELERILDNHLQSFPN
jgi:hypothetical protein